MNTRDTLKSVLAVVASYAVFFALIMAFEPSRAQAPAQRVAPAYDPELREVNDRLMALENAIGRFSMEHLNILSDQAKANADVAATKARVDMISKQLDDITKSGTPMDSGRLAALETKMNLILGFAGTLVTGLITLEITRVRIVAKRK